MECLYFCVRYVNVYVYVIFFKVLFSVIFFGWLYIYNCLFFFNNRFLLLVRVMGIVKEYSMCVKILLINERYVDYKSR